MGFSWHGVVVRLDAMLFDVSLPPITILHLSAPGARLVLIDIDWDRDRMQRIYGRRSAIQDLQHIRIHKTSNGITICATNLQNGVGFTSKVPMY